MITDSEGAAMKIHEIDNGVISIAVREKGAELASIRKDGKEYLWNADPSVWNRSAPQLFPIVGTLNNNEYVYNGKTYGMSRHGFARDSMFTLSRKTDTDICFEFRDTAETLAVYPFPFLFEVEYILRNNVLTYVWRIINTGDKTMYFSVGGHPAFMCPVSGGKITDCSIGFAGKEPVNEIRCETINAAGLLQSRSDTYGLSNGIVRISDDMFSHDVLILENSGVHSISLLDKSGKTWLRVDFDTDIVGLWSPQDKGAPFLCIEPWYGRCDRENFKGELNDREWGNSLESGEKFEKSFTVTVL
jgi:galactose mutarotase-like enzyme